MRSKRLDRLPPYLFVEVDRLKASLKKSGAEVLDLGIGDPDIGPPEVLIQSLKEALKNPEHHRYPHDRGHPLLISAVIDWARSFFGVELDESEVLVTIGSKEAVGHLPLAVADRGDVFLVPDPGYPVYRSSVILADVEYHDIPLVEEKGFWPDLGAVPSETLKRARALILNYPNNPTSAVVNEERFKEAVEFSEGKDILLVNDAAYSELVFDGVFTPLFPLAKDSGIEYIEFFSFSKTFSITGWRVGYAIGSAEVISALAEVKSNLDSGVFDAIQEAVARVMRDGYEGVVNGMRKIYADRRELLNSYLEKTDLEFRKPSGTFYFWIRVPGGYDSISFCRFLLERKGIVATPGIGFGRNGEGYFRLSVTSSEEVIEKAGRALVELSEKKWK